MGDTVVILGVVTIVAVVAVVVVAIVYGRPIWVRATRSSVEVDATDEYHSSKPTVTKEIEPRSIQEND